MATTPKPEGTIRDTYRCALIKVLVFMTVFSAIVGMALLVYVIYDKFIYKEELTRETLVKRYPGYFWTREEYLHYSRLLNSSMKDTTVHEYFLKFCNTDCPKRPWYSKSTGRRRRDAGVISSGNVYHGCCLSDTYYTSPLQQVNENGVNRNLFHLLPDAQQFFKVSSCIENVKCTGCHCMYEEELHSVVVVKAGISVTDATMDDLEIDVLTFNGCCKCVNDGT